MSIHVGQWPEVQLNLRRTDSDWCAAGHSDALRLASLKALGAEDEDGGQTKQRPVHPGRFGEYKGQTCSSQSTLNADQGS